MNEENKPVICQASGERCTNKVYGRNYLTPKMFEWVCRKHYYLYNYGITYKYWSRDRQ